MCELSSNSWWSPSTKFLEITRHSLLMSMVSKPSLMTSMYLNYTQIHALQTIVNLYVMLFPIPFFFAGQRWLYIWWSVLLTAHPRGSLPPHSSVIWSRPISKPSSHRSEWSCLPHAQSSPQHSSSSCCRMHQQVSAQTHACVTASFQHTLNLSWFCLCRSGPNHLGASQGRQPRSWEVS